MKYALIQSLYHFNDFREDHLTGLRNNYLNLFFHPLSVDIHNHFTLRARTIDQIEGFLFGNDPDTGEPQSGLFLDEHADKCAHRKPAPIYNA